MRWRMVNIDNVIDEFWDPGTDPQEARRYFLNQITHSTDAFLSSVELGACVEPKPVDLGTPITLGFDGSRGRAKGKADATALIACRLSDGYMWQVLVRSRRTIRRRPRVDGPVFRVRHGCAADVPRLQGWWAFYADPSGGRRMWRAGRSSSTAGCG